MANITRSDPFRDLTRWDPWRTMEDFYRRLRPHAVDHDIAPTIALDVTQNDKAYSVKAEIPGVKKEDIQVSVDGNRVTISAEVKREKEEKDTDTICRERYYGRQERSFMLDQDVDDAKCDATYKDGILQLTLPKKPGGAKKQLSVR